MMLYIAHRGFRVGVVENTFPGFNKAFALQMDYIEFDLHLSNDGILYIMHDSTLDRTMNASGDINRYSSRELDDIRTKDGKEVIPRFETLIEKRSEWDTQAPKLMVELKGKGTGIAAANMIKKYHLEHETVFSGRNLTEITDAHDICPNVKICLNITKCKQYTLEDLLQAHSKEDLPLPITMISLKSTHSDMEPFIKKCHELGIIALSWHFLDYADPIEKMKELILLKIDGLLFDDPNTVESVRTWLNIKK